MFLGQIDIAVFQDHPLPLSGGQALGQPHDAGPCAAVGAITLQRVLAGGALGTIQASLSAVRAKWNERFSEFIKG
ncbi:uncharacterized protein TNCV_2482621 [Trichonephila clavipes]|uniref:Uncharacterized protein n=1 Tax=Trichonephila clavipes TaxID=2585209 RepID=A0A8X7BAJ7_TRICX|nr:uncharacterized protein TNCV_2482621 [Trichonephila clavipes]